MDKNGDSFGDRVQDFSPGGALTGELARTRQVMRNPVLIGMAFSLNLLAVGRSLCVAPDRRFMKGDYEIVGGAVGWEKDGTFCRVNLDGCARANRGGLPKTVG